MADQLDSWDAMRAGTWDLYNGDQPEDRLDVLLGVLGVSGSLVSDQQAALRAWLASAAARPAPPQLLGAVGKFLEVPVA